MLPQVGRGCKRSATQAPLVHNITNFVVDGGGRQLPAGARRLAGDGPRRGGGRGLRRDRERAGGQHRHPLAALGRGDGGAPRRARARSASPGCSTRSAAAPRPTAPRAAARLADAQARRDPRQRVRDPGARRRRPARPTRGVDSSHEASEAFAAGSALAQELGTVVAITGAVDHVTDGERLLRVSNGDPRDDPGDRARLRGERRGRRVPGGRARSAARPRRARSRSSASPASARRPAPPGPAACASGSSTSWRRSTSARSAQGVRIA